MSVDGVDETLSKTDDHGDYDPPPPSEADHERVLDTARLLTVENKRLRGIICHLRGNLEGANGEQLRAFGLSFDSEQMEAAWAIVEEDEFPLEPMWCECCMPDPLPRDEWKVGCCTYCGVEVGA